MIQHTQDCVYGGYSERTVTVHEELQILSEDREESIKKFYRKTKLNMSNEHQCNKYLTLATTDKWRTAIHFIKFQMHVLFFSRFFDSVRQAEPTLQPGNNSAKRFCG